MTRHTAWWQRLWREERATTALEFSLIASLLMVLIFGAIDWSRFYYNRARIRSAVRRGALYAARIPTALWDSATIATTTRAALVGTAAERALGVVDVEITGATGSNARASVAWVEFPFTRATALLMPSGRKDSVRVEFRREQP